MSTRPKLRHTFQVLAERVRRRSDRPPLLVRTRELARLVGIPAATLRWWRHRLQGPPFIRTGPKSVWYSVLGVSRWLKARTVRTGETRKAARARARQSNLKFG